MRNDSIPLMWHDVGNKKVIPKVDNFMKYVMTKNEQGEWFKFIIKIITIYWQLKYLNKTVFLNYKEIKWKYLYKY